ncbi:MAG TPA: Flp family type IVb pilin [Candidatus Rubrimentiphilum sp.]|nr:Flp family type IVb pilin [Candidatus Rubrimentiphilum sp.]
MKNLMSLWRDDSAATMVEYGIMVALIAAVCIVLVLTLGQNVSNAFNSVNNNL